MDDSDRAPESDPGQTADASRETTTDESTQVTAHRTPVSRRSALAALLGVGGLGLVSGQATAEHNGPHWNKDVDAEGQKLFDLGSLAMTANATEITDFAGDNLAIDGNGVLNATDTDTDTRTDVSDDGATTVEDTDDINFAANLDVTDDGDGSVSVDAADTDTDTHTNVSDDGSQVVADTADINFATNLDVTDDGDGSVTVDGSSVSPWADDDSDALLEASGFDGIDVNFVKTPRLGTTDTTAFEGVVDDERFLRIVPTASDAAPNIIAGHLSNSVPSSVAGATIAGGGANGNSNTVTASFGTVGGGASNDATGSLATVGGGNFNEATASAATVGGGNGNLATNNGTTVGGGSENEAPGFHATVGGGISNDATGDRATIGGGSGNKVTDTLATIGGGHLHEATEAGATIGGGSGNKAGLVATVPGGAGNIASGDFSFAAGKFAKTETSGGTAHDGAVVFGDSSATDVRSRANNQFVVQAGGGARLYSSSNLSTGVELPAGGGSWSSLSARAAKTNTQSVDTGTVLDEVENLDISTWEYDSEEEATHMGPMAEDFHDAFELGDSEERIATVDADGVALAAIQELAEQLEEKDAELDDMRAENEQLRERLAAVEEQLAGLEPSPSSTDD